ncbi:MAG: twin-arginine translocase subunit TatC [Chthoniobacterales bacterium]|jgi:sec-independent protein translocase protein TatC|nr:twin-arginine translocase subunit TatC [Chthoniobacterales bacterium]
MELKNLFSFREQSDEALPFMDHLGDLRVMIIRIAVTLVLAMVGAFFFRGILATVVQRPLIAVDPIRASSLQSLGVADSMTISLELSFYAGLIISFPIILIFIAQFLFPALKPTERKILLPVAAFGMALFVTGILFAYVVVLPGTLDFFFKDAKSMHWTPTWTVREYYSFTTQFMIAFGVAFEMPMVVLALVKIGILNTEKLRKARSVAIITIFTVAAFITPSPDFVTYLLMGGPMVVLYEFCIVLAKWVEPKTTIAVE